MKRPNILLISIDTLRADHVSCYGYHRKTTPNLDQIASEGVLYKNAYSTAAWTPPAHASMLTGLYPSTHGVIDDRRLNRSIPTLAETLLKQGYRTAGFVNNSQVGEFVGLDKGHETFCEIWRGTRPKTAIERGARYLARKTKEVIGASDHGAHKTNVLVKQWLNDNGRKPFYLFIHYIEPHNPIKAPRPFRYKYLDENIGKVNERKIELVAYNPLICFTDNIILNEEEKKVLIALYDGEIDYLDKKIGELIEYLKKNNNIYDDTLIIITADHGEHFGEHDLYSHVASLYEPIIHIPLIIKFPEAHKKQGLITGLVQIVDIFPTVMEVIQCEDEFWKEVQGTSLLNTDNDAKCHDYIIAEWEGRIPDFVSRRIRNRELNPLIDQFKEPITMIREGNYKYILHGNGREELYDLGNDRNELNNIFETKIEIGRKLREKAGRWQSLKTDQEYEKQSSMDEITRKNLESLGYL